MFDFIKTIIAFPFGLIAELSSIVAMNIQPDLDLDFNYLKDNHIITHKKDK